VILAHSHTCTAVPALCYSNARHSQLLLLLPVLYTDTRSTTAFVANTITAAAAASTAAAAAGSAAVVISTVL
jgi:hypothetical protein